VLNHSFTAVKGRFRWKLPKLLATIFSWALTFTAVVVGWVFFRATSLDGALSILSGMAGMNGVSVPAGILAQMQFAEPIWQWLGIQARMGGGAVFISTWGWSLALVIVAVAAPNVHDLFYSYLADESHAGNVAPKSRWQWHPNRRWAMLLAFLLVMGVSTLGQISEFLYFNF
jgi:hypothetical protein